MLFGKKYNLVGLDIGSCTFKVGEIVDSKKGRSLKNFSMLDIPPGVIEEGTIREPDIAAQKIRELFKTAGIKEQNVAISIGGFSIIVKNITVQTMTEDELQSTIQLEAEQYIPFDISDVNLDFHIIGENENNPNQMNVILVAAKKEMVEDYLNVVQIAGLNPILLDVDAFALQNIFELNYEGEKESVALIDIGMPDKDGLEVTQILHQDFPQIKVIILGLIDLTDEIMTCIEAGATGYILKESSFEQLVETIRSVHRNEAFCSPRMAASLFSRIAELTSESKTQIASASVKLTERELDVLRLIAEGLPNKEIAKRLFIEAQTVKNHIHNILDKLQLHNRFETVQYARERKLLKKK